MMTFDGLLPAVLDASEIGFVILDEAARVVLWNRWMVRASGIAAAEAPGRGLAELFPGAAGPRLLQAVDDALERGLSAILSSTLNKTLLPLHGEAREDGQPQPLKLVAVVKPLRLGTRRGCLLQVTDITGAALREQVLRQQARTMQALAENYRLSELHMRAILDNTGDAIVTFDEGGRIGTYNPAAEQVFGYRPTEIVDMAVGRLIPELAPSDGGSPATIAERFMNRRREVTGRRSDGTAFPLELSVSAMELGGQRLFVGIAHDITERKRAEAELHAQKEWLSTLINAMPDIVCFRDGDGRWLVANEFCLRLIGLEGASYHGRDAAQLAVEAPAFARFLLDSLPTDQLAWREGRPVTYETSLTLADDSAKTFDMLKLPLYNPDGSRKGLVVVGRDITERKQQAARIYHLAHHDSLTGLPNRVLFQERLRQALAQARRNASKVALLLCDLDKFKDVNDTLGHHVGDLLLQAVARRLMICVRETDTVARLGGDEFAILLTNLSLAEGPSRVADEVIRLIAEPFALDGAEVITSTSVGVTLFPEDTQDADQLLKFADLALYRSKNEGRNTYHFYVATMDEEVQARKAIERDLRHALGSDQLMLHFQPLIDLRSGQILGSEALVRWRHPQRGFISPGQFIPIIERTELIYPLGRWVLEQACRQAVAWRRAGLRAAQMAINLSAAQFKAPDLVGMVTEILARTGMAPELLQLEITESIAMHNVEQTIETLDQLRRMGLRISIDDFGTGYSSLNYLKRFPVDKLKIDRSFVVDIGCNRDNEAILRAIINLGHGIGTKVNVEGVETSQQLAFLRQHGVDEAQGFLFGKPLPAAEFAIVAADPAPWWMVDA